MTKQVKHLRTSSRGRLFAAGSRIPITTGLSTDETGRIIGLTTVGVEAKEESFADIRLRRLSTLRDASDVSSQEKLRKESIRVYKFIKTKTDDKIDAFGVISVTATPLTPEEELAMTVNRMITIIVGARGYDIVSFRRVKKGSGISAVAVIEPAHYGVNNVYCYVNLMSFSKTSSKKTRLGVLKKLEIACRRLATERLLDGGRSNLGIRTRFHLTDEMKDVLSDSGYHDFGDKFFINGVDETMFEKELKRPSGVDTTRIWREELMV